MIELTVPSWVRHRTQLWNRIRRDPDWWIALGLLLLALILRLASVVDIPPGLHGDEAWTGLRVEDILNGTRVGAFDALHGLGQPSGMEYLTAAFAAIFGNSILTIRLPMALLGAITVPLTYALVRTMQGRNAAVIAGLILALMSWHIHYSRIALPPISAPFFEVLSALLFVLAARSGSRWLFVSAGLALGFGVYSYSSYNIYVLVFAVFAAYWVLTRPAAERRDLVINVGLLFAAALLAALPMLASIYQNSDTYFSYPREISLFNSDNFERAETISGQADVVLDAGRDYVKRVVFDENADFSDAAGTRPMLETPLSVLLGLGMLYAIWRWREPLPFLALIGVLFVPWSGILTVDSGIIRRTIGVTPFVAILAALPLAWGIAFAEKKGAVFQRASYIMAFLVIAAIGILSLNGYFRDLSDTEAAEYVFAPQLVAASEYMDDLPDSTLVYFYSDQWSINYETSRYLAPDVNGEDRSNAFGATGVSFETDRRQDVAYILMPPYLESIAEIERLYPGGTTYTRESDDEDEEPYFIAYDLPGLQPGETPIAPLPTFVPTPTQTVQPGGEDRDRQRQLAFVQLQRALQDYYDVFGSYPDNDGGIQSLCNFPDADVGCKLLEVVDEIPRDPLEGDPSVIGFFYSSNGDRYAVYANRESEAYAACDETPDHAAHLRSVMCLKGP